MSVNDAIAWRKELYSYTINGQLIYFIKYICAETFLSNKFYQHEYIIRVHVSTIKTLYNDSGNILKNVCILIFKDIWTSLPFIISYGCYSISILTKGFLLLYTEPWNGTCKLFELTMVQVSDHLGPFLDNNKYINIDFENHCTF